MIIFPSFQRKQQLLNLKDMIDKQVKWKQMWNLCIYLWNFRHQCFHPWSNQLSQGPEGRAKSGSYPYSPLLKNNWLIFLNILWCRHTHSHIRLLCIRLKLWFSPIFLDLEKWSKFLLREKSRLQKSLWKKLSGSLQKKSQHFLDKVIKQGANRLSGERKQ